MKRYRNRNSGFTMLEVVAVLIIIGIVGLVVMSRVSSTVVYELKSETEVIKGHLRYAQSRAMNTNSVWGINFSSSTGYSLYKAGDINNRVILPAEDSDQVSLPSGMTVTTGIVSFNQWGVPCMDEDAETEQVGTRAVSVSFHGDHENISITQNTGFIP